MKECKSVVEAFDKMQLCYTVFPQLKHYYRFGELRDCSKERKYFNDCLVKKKTDSKGDDDDDQPDRPSSQYWDIA